MTTEPLNVEKTSEDDSWRDRIDAIKFTTRVFSDLKAKYGADIGEDFVLAKLPKEEAEFIIQQTKTAFSFKNDIPDEEVGRKIFNTIMLEVYMRAILSRNIDRNVMLGILSGNQEAQDREDDAKLVSAIEKFKNSGEPKVME